MNVDAGAQTV